MTAHCATCTCEPEPIRPEGCVCKDLNSWGNPQKIPPPCRRFVRYYEDAAAFCDDCEHEYGCHPEAARA